MSFIFQPETGEGLTNSTSYVTVEQADDITARNIHETTWPSLTTDQKERLLSQASQLLDAYAKWDGRKVVAKSALGWPRSGAKDADGTAIADDEIPRDLIEGTVELARQLAREDRTMPRDQDGLVSMKADVVELEFRETSRPVIPSFIWRILAAITPSPSRSKRIIR